MYKPKLRFQALFGIHVLHKPDPHLNGNGVRDVGERGRDVEEEVEDDEVVPVLRLVLQLRTLHPDPRPHEALAARVDRVVRVCSA